MLKKMLSLACFHIQLVIKQLLSMPLAFYRKGNSVVSFFAQTTWTLRQVSVKFLAPLSSLRFPGKQTEIEICMWGILLEMLSGVREWRSRIKERLWFWIMLHCSTGGSAAGMAIHSCLLLVRHAVSTGQGSCLQRGWIPKEKPICESWVAKGKNAFVFKGELGGAQQCLLQSLQNQCPMISDLEEE